MKMKSTLGALATLTAILGDGLTGPGSLPTDRRDLSEGIKRSVEKSKESYNRLLVEKKGVKQFEIDGKVILARNLKNAQIKAAKG